MSLSEALFKLLNNQEEPLEKRLKIADRAFNASEFRLKHKEALLVKWIGNSLTNFSEHEHWLIVNKWLASEDFKHLTQNDITNNDIGIIIQLFQDKLLNANTPTIAKQQIVDYILLLCNNKVFQQYFKYNAECYCNMLANTLQTIECSTKFIDFIGKQFLFPKNLLIEEQFPINFLHILYPVLIKKSLEFSKEEAFIEIVNVVQKCLLQPKIKQFQDFINHLFDTNLKMDEEIGLPKAFLKYLAGYLHKEDSLAPISFKIFFAAFTEIFRDCELPFKLFIFIMVLMQFNNSNDFPVIKVPFKLKTAMKLTKSMTIIVEMLDVICIKNYSSDCNVLNVTLTDFIRNILKLLISLNINDPLVLKIILKAIVINPLIIEPIVAELIAFVMIRNYNCDQYEETVVAIIEIFAKLHRVESLFSKIIPALKSALVNDQQVAIDGVKYSFNGQMHLNNIPSKDLKTTNLFTEKILNCITRCIIVLASWQIINIFKTLLYHLRSTVDDFFNDQLDNANGVIYLDSLGVLITFLLQSVRISEHTTPQNVQTKFLKGLEDLKNVLRNLGLALLKREHNHITMHTFLSLSHTWAELYLTLAYYSGSNEVQLVTKLDNTSGITNLQYLHSYMDGKEWQLITQRITNFGEYPCKIMLQNLYIQKLRAMLLLETDVKEEVANNIVKTLQTHLATTWKDLLMDKFTVIYILPKMDQLSLCFLAEKLIENSHLLNSNHLKDSLTLTNATVYLLMSKINKLFKRKRKHDGEEIRSLRMVLLDLPFDVSFLSLYNQLYFFLWTPYWTFTQIKRAVDSDFNKMYLTLLPMSNRTFKIDAKNSTIFALCPKEAFFLSDDITDDKFNFIIYDYDNWQHNGSHNVKEDKLQTYIEILQNVSFIYSQVTVQKYVILYLFSLNMDVVNCSEELKKKLESLLIGILQMCKFPLTEIFKLEKLGAQILSNFQSPDVAFSLIIDNSFKHENSILSLEPLVLYLTKHLGNSIQLRFSLLLLQALNKVKKSKMDIKVKETANQFKEKILKKVSKTVLKSDNLIEAYATCLKHYLSTEKADGATLTLLLNQLEVYLKYALANNNCSNNYKGCAVLFSTVLQHKSQILSLPTDIVGKIWNASKQVSFLNEYSHLVTLVVTLIPNQEFDGLVKDLYHLTDDNIKKRLFPEVIQQLKTWQSVVTCDVNAVKMKVWQDILEDLFCELLRVMKNDNFNKDLWKGIIQLQQGIISAQHFILSSPLIDMFISTPSILMAQYLHHHNFDLLYTLSISTMKILLRHRNAIVMDRLPVYLQQYRILLKAITFKSDSEANDKTKLDTKKASDCVHSLENLTKDLVSYKKDMGRIAVFLISDILERFEQVNMYPNVKLHLNNCVYSLIGLCDHHAVSYLMRTLSGASTEMFKIMYEHYKKYYMFTGKV